MKTRSIFFILTTAAVLSFNSCSSSEKKNSSDKISTYTFNTTSTSPLTWNSSDYQQNNESLVISLTGMGLYDFVMDETKTTYKVVCEMARDFPENVTKLYAGKKFGIPSDANSGYAWKFNIIENACWDDGTPITADTYEYSIRQYLNPEMKNFRAAIFYEDTLALVNGLSYYEGKCDWSKVGFIKNDDFSFTLILSKAVTPFFIEYATTSPFLLKEDLYEANKKKTGDIIKTAYNTSLSTCASYGPYKVSSFQPDKEMQLVKNEKWYGWTDGRHNGQYQTTGFNIQYITEHATALNLFLQGKLDEIGLTANDLKIYGNSAFRQTTPASYTWKFSFNIDKAALKKENISGENHIMIAYKDFRHGISLSLDRQNYVDTVAPASDVGFGLMNYLYVADVDSGTLYRDTEYAEKILCEVYEADNLDELTGYDKTKASEYLIKAYNEALKAGDILPDEKIVIDYHTYNAEESNMKSVNFLQDSLNAACSGTVLEGKILIKQITDEDYYNNMKKGNVDCAMTAWGGAAFDPYGITWCYCTKEALNEFGFDPETEKLTIELNGKKITKTFTQWHVALNNTEYSNADSEVRNKILSEIEKALLLNFNMIPIRYMNSTGLNSHRVIEGSDHYVNSLVNYGDLRFRTYSMDDEQWNAYCAKNKFKLKY